MFQKHLFTIGICISLSGCFSAEPPRDVKDVSSQNTATIFPPKVTKSSPEMLEVRYAQTSVGFDAGCNPVAAFKSKLNQCSKLPENVKLLATEHCAKFGKEAKFLGNKSNLLQMTVSKFSCGAS